ncbi:hypothetical protein JW851_00965 [Candidatus Woesearchaeota archaeon]|nr:hypothetical protein [Candidatus Woesearchaeota archaeon]
MANDTLELLEVPTRARTEEESELLDDICSDSELKNKSLRERVVKHTKNNNFSLVFWYHYNGIKRSFEDTFSALDTVESYKKKKPTLPKIIGIRQHTDYS